MDFEKVLLAILLVIGSLGYLYSVYQAIRLSIKSEPSKMPAFLIQVIDTIGAALALNFGAVIGIEVTNGSPGIMAVMEDMPLMSAAAVVYLLALLATLIGWAITGWSNDPEKVVSVVPAMSKSLLGVVVGAFGVALGLP